MLSKRFKIIIGLSVLLNILHGVEVSLTHFYVKNPDFYRYTKLFHTIPEAVYYVQHGMLYLCLVLFFLYILGGKWRLIPFIFFGYLLVSETHHFFRGIFALSYQPGMITSALFIIISYLFMRQLFLEYKNIITVKKPTLIPELKVLNFKESLDFYTKIAGFKVLYDRPEEDFAMLGINSARIMIEGLTPKSRTWKVGNLERPFGRGMHFQIEVPDVQNLYDNFKKADYPLFVDMEEKWYRMNNIENGNKQFLVQDPDGYLLRFFQDLGMRSLIGKTSSNIIH